MVKVLSVEMLKNIIQKHGINQFIRNLISYIKADFSKWDSFHKTPRSAAHVPGGVIELMPINNDQLYSYKYVNGHPKNPESRKQTVIATGQLSRVKDGYPVMISEMTVLTALRTAATSALASDLLSRKDSITLGLIGTGAQSEFQVLAHKLIRDFQHINYYDIDENAMSKFKHNMQNYGIDTTQMDSAKCVAESSDVLIICTACKKHVDVIKQEWIRPGTHINGLGGDCPGKTEIDKKLLPNSKVIVEFFEQSFIEGEIQRFDKKTAKNIVHAELWEIINSHKQSRINNTEITIFDSVGFAIEDFSALRLTYDLACQYAIGKDINMIPPISDPKNLISILEHNKIKGIKVIA